MFRAVSCGKQELRRSRLKRFESSGMTVVQFCRRERVSAPCFYQWRKRLATSHGTTSPPTFVPLRLRQLESPVEIHLPNGARVCVPPGDAGALRLAVEVAGQLNGGQEKEHDAC